MRTKRALRREAKARRARERELGRGGRTARTERRRTREREAHGAALSAARAGQPCGPGPMDGAAHLDGLLALRRPESRPAPTVARAESYGGRLIWGAVCGRVWIGEPGASELVSRVGLVDERIPLEERPAQEAQARRQVEELLAADYRQATGFETLEADRIEWLVSWDADGHLLGRCRAFEAGYVRPSVVVAPSRMTLADIKAHARAWGVRPQAAASGAATAQEGAED